MFYDFGTPVSPDVVLALKQEIFSSLHVALPGIVESFDPETLTVSVRPALRRRAGPEGEPIPVPILREVPVFWPAFSDPEVTLSVQPGDMCLRWRHGRNSKVLTSWNACPVLRRHR